MLYIRCFCSSSNVNVFGCCAVVVYIVFLCCICCVCCVGGVVIFWGCFMLGLLILGRDIFWLVGFLSDAVFYGVMVFGGFLVWVVFWML